MTASDNTILVYHDPMPVSGSVIEWVQNFWQPALDLHASIVLIEPELLSLEGRKMISKIKAFKILPQNWDSYGAAAPSVRAVDDALAFVRTLDERGEHTFFSAPGPDGEVLIELKDGEKSIEITFSDSDPTSFAKFNGSDCVEEGELTPESLSSILLWLHV